MESTKNRYKQAGKFSKSIWERDAAIRGGCKQNSESLWDTGICGIVSWVEKCPEIAVDHSFDHRQQNFQKLIKQISGYSEVGIAPGLGPGDRVFESHYSDQTPSEIEDFRGGLL